MPAYIPILLIASLALAVFAIVACVLGVRAKKRAAQANAAYPRDVIEVDLGGRLPAQRRRPCGRHGEGGGNCDDCEHKHEHDEHDEHGGHCHKH